MAVRIVRRGASVELHGHATAEQAALVVLKQWWAQTQHPLDEATLASALVQAQTRGTAVPEGAASNGANDSGPQARQPEESVSAQSPVLHTRRSELRGRTPNQVQYLRQLLQHDVTLGIGPAGTGKTFLAVAAAVDALERHSVQRLVLTRPAVEAGERLGFLPGDLAQKVDPYLRPLYDALYDLMGLERVNKAFEKGLIEIAPLAFMRGRTLNHAFIILDEAQNTTREQMKMFLTRLGFGSRCVVTGDVSQIDLPQGVSSGLIEAERILAGVDGIALTRFSAVDVVRHPLVARIVEAYDAAQASASSQAMVSQSQSAGRALKSAARPPRRVTPTGTGSI